MRRLTIGMFTDTYLPEVNGVVSSIVATAKSLRRRGHRVVIVAPANPADSGTADDEPDVFRFRSAPFPFYPQFRMAFPLPARLLAQLPRVPFDLIHAHSVFFLGCLGAYLAQWRGVPLAFTYHTRLEDYIHYLPVHHRVTSAQAVWLSREFAKRCDLIVAPTHEIEQLLRSYGVESPIHVIPSGVDIEAFGADNTQADAIKRAASGPLALYAGRLGTEKNLDLLLDAFAFARTSVPNATLVVAGDGPHRSTMEERARQADLAEHVIFTGTLSHAALGAYYRAADAFVFASTTETQGLVVLEAMALGLPVAAVDHPVIREAMGERAGILTAESAEALGAAIARLLVLSPAERARGAVAALEAAAPYSTDARAAQLEALYDRCVALSGLSR